MDFDFELALKIVQAVQVIDVLTDNGRSGNHRILQMRGERGQFHTLYAELREDATKFRSYTRMSVAAFDKLVAILRPRLVRNSRRDPICPEQRLLVTLKYLATGASFVQLGFDFFLGETTVRSVIHDTCTAIAEELAGVYLKVPSTPEEWIAIADGFWLNWDMPNCLGAIDGKHVRMRAPPNSGSMNFNYKGYFSTVMLAVSDYRHRIIYLSVGHYGREGDSGIYERSDFARAINDDDNPLNLPPDEPLPGTNVSFPFFFLGDGAFPLQKRMMKPYGQQNLNREKRGFNYRVTRARRVVESTFGHMSQRWRLPLKSIETNFDNCVVIVRAISSLHNYLIDEGEAKFIERDGRPVANEMEQAANLRHPQARRARDVLEQQRQKLVDFFMGPGFIDFRIDPYSEDEE